MKWKQARVNTAAPTTSVRPQVAAETDDNRVAYCAILDSVPSESSYLLGETSGSRSIPQLYILVSNLRVSV
jgi:hypothetical protein